MARKRDYEDGDFDPPKRSSLIRIFDDEYEDDYDDTYRLWMKRHTSSSVKRRKVAATGRTAKLLVAVIVLLQF
ncbi:MAG: hypothetical protein ACLSIR_10560 [Christensenellales bacterium]